MKEPLVLLPSMMGDARVFSHQINVLSRDIPVMTVPLSGGERVEEIASSLLDHLPHRFALCGLSFGGIVAMEILRRAPERVARLCLISCSPLPESPADAAAREPLIISARMGRLDEAMQGSLRPEHLAPGPRRMEVLALLSDMAAEAGAEVFASQSRALQRRRDQQGTMRRCKVPVRVICGAHDTLVPQKRQSFLAELAPMGRLDVVAGAGHLPPLEAPAETLDILSDWLKSPRV